MRRRRVVLAAAWIGAMRLSAPAAGAGLVGGPMVGHTTDRTVKVWARTDTAAELALIVSARPDLPTRGASQDAPLLAEGDKSKAVRATAETDFAATMDVEGLAPATRYSYQVLIDGKPAVEPPLPAFATFPPAGRPAKVRVLFGGGIRFQVDPEQTIWDDMAKQEPAAFISMGDNTYPDNPIPVDLYKRLTAGLDLGGNERLMEVKRDAYVEIGGFLYHRVYYRIQQSLPPYRRFVRGVPTYAVWDDHDAFHNGQGGARLPMAQRLESIRAFRENFANPSYGKMGLLAVLCG